jgi:hypothetical protein
MSWRGVRGQALGGFRDKLDFLFNLGEAREGLEEIERGCHVSAVMQGNRGLACCSFHSGEYHKSQW